MRWIVIGAGGVGGTIGGLLARTGHDVVLVARGEHGRRIREYGLHLATPRFDERIGLRVAAGPGDVELSQDDVLLLAVKSQDSQAALDAWKSVEIAGGGTAAARLPVVCAQNGIANEAAALRRFDTVVGMYVWLPGTYVEPGSVEAQGHPAPGVLAIGGYPAGGDDALLAAIAADLRTAGFRVPVVRDVMAWKAAKLLTNLGNAAEAALGPIEPGSRAEQANEVAMAEGERVLAAAGIAVATPETIAEVLAGMGVRPVNGRARSGGSTWQSLVRGANSVEADYLNGEIALLGRLHGIPTPVNRDLQDRVNLMAARGERPGAGGQRL
jgi:2-dehydropantoate 2-reductase